MTGVKGARVVRNIRIKIRILALKNAKPSKKKDLKPSMVPKYPQSQLRRLDKVA